MQILMNWLWQGITVALVVNLVVRLLDRRMNAATRERIWWIALMAVVAIPLVHLIPFLLGSAEGTPITQPGAHAQRLVVSVPAPAPILVATAWGIWTMVAVMRLGASLVRLLRAKRHVRPLPAAREARLVTWSMLRHQGRPTRLVTSSMVHRAGVLGLGRPLIALSPAVLTRLSDEELDEIVVHEYAHVQRCDDVTVLIQHAIVAIAGLHPAIWWIGRALSVEREVACDDWVLAQGGAVRRYASCLVALVSTPDPALDLSPGAALGRAQVTVRVARLLDRDRNQTIARSRLALWVAKPAMAALVAAGAALPFIEIVRERPVPVSDMPLPAIAQSRSVLTPARSLTLSRPPAAGRVPGWQAAPDRASRPGILTVNAEAAPAEESGTMTSHNTPIAMTPPATPVSDPLLPPQAVQVSAVDGHLLPAVTVEPGAFLLEESAPAIAKAPATWEPTWRPAADMGVAIGKGSREAAAKTVGFFTSLGRSMASSF